MSNRYVINFRIAQDQVVSKDSVVTYLDQNRISTLKEFLIIKTDFFIVDDIIDNRIIITNGIDSIETTEDQLLCVLPYIEEITDVEKPSLGIDPSKYLIDLIKWRETEELRRSYPIKDKQLSIISSGLIITGDDFFLHCPRTKENIFYACLIPEKISTYIG